MGSSKKRKSCFPHIKVPQFFFLKYKYINMFLFFYFFIHSIPWLFPLWPLLCGGAALQLPDLHRHLNSLSLRVQVWCWMSFWAGIWMDFSGWFMHIQIAKEENKTMQRASDNLDLWGKQIQQAMQLKITVQVRCYSCATLYLQRDSFFPTLHLKLNAG